MKIIFRAYEKLKFEAFSRIVEKLILFVLVIVALLNKISVEKIFFLYMLSALVGLVCTVNFLRRFGMIKFHIDFEKWKMFLKEGLPFFLIGIKPAPRASATAEPKIKPLASTAAT